MGIAAYRNDSIPLIFGAVSQLGSLGDTMPGLYDTSNTLAVIGLLQGLIKNVQGLGGVAV